MGYRKKSITHFFCLFKFDVILQQVQADLIQKIKFMKEFIITTIIGMIITWVISSYDIFGLEKDLMPFDVPHKIRVVAGTIGCLTQESLQEIAQASVKKDEVEMKRIMGLGLCSYFPAGVDLMLHKDSCKSGKDAEIFEAVIIKTKSKIFMTCSVLR